MSWFAWLAGFGRAIWIRPRWLIWYGPWTTFVSLCTVVSLGHLLQLKELPPTVLHIRTLTTFRQRATISDSWSPIPSFGDTHHSTAKPFRLLKTAKVLLLRVTNWVLCQKALWMHQTTQETTICQRTCRKEGEEGNKCFAAQNSHNINHSLYWFPKDTDTYYISIFVWPKRRCVLQQDYFGESEKEARSRKALALSRAKTKVDLSRVTDSIESCIWSREAVQCCMCCYCCCRVSVGCRWAASMLHPNFSCLYHNVFSNSTSQIPSLTKLRVAIFTKEMKCYTVVFL